MRVFYCTLWAFDMNFAENVTRERLWVSVNQFAVLGRLPKTHHYTIQLCDGSWLIKRKKIAGHWCASGFIASCFTLECCTLTRSSCKLKRERKRILTITCSLTNTKSERANLVRYGAWVTDVTPSDWFSLSNGRSGKTDNRRERM